MPALDERKSAILKAIVQDYVRSGEPVGSRRIVEQWGLGVSAATVRAEMAALEEAGFIGHPHTSAGRVPTDKGYRYFVDALADKASLDPEQRRILEEVLLGANDLEELLQRASSALSRLTRFATLVAAPELDRSRLRHVELVPLGPRSVIAVFITDTGRVEKRMLDMDGPVAEHDVHRARHAVNEAAAGLRLASVPDVVAGVAAGAPVEVRGLVDALARAITDGLTTTPQAEPVIVGGTANIVDAGYFERIEQVKQVYEALEEQVVVWQVLRDTLDAGDPAVRIGSELPLVELAACSIVAKTYEAGGAAGRIGVLGPTRMDYPGTLAAVQAVAASIEKALGELTGERS